MMFFSSLVSSISVLLTTINVVSAAYETINGHDCIRSMEGMWQSLDDLASSHPDLVTITKIGESYLKNNEGRTSSGFDIPVDGHDINVVIVTDESVPSDGKGVALYTSGVHAREYAPPELAARFIETLVNGYGSDADITTLLLTTEIHWIPYVNPDGRWVAERYPDLYWRKNLNPNGGCNYDDSYGVDINRNFDFVHGDPAGASNDPCDSDYHGPSPESEPETAAVSNYARNLFPESQRKNNPEAQWNVPFGEDITGLYADIHSSGGFVYYPWGHVDKVSPDDEALQAIGRKVNSFNDYKIWAGGQADFMYEASGDASDYMYAVLGVASLGFEIGDDFYQNCNRMDEIVEINLPALMYTTSIAKAPYKQVKGPDVLSVDVDTSGGSSIELSAHVSDSEMVNAIVGSDFDEFITGDQDIAEVRVYVDVHPDDYTEGSGDISLLMAPTRRRNLQEAEEYTPKRVRSMQCSSYTSKRPCKRAGKTQVCNGNGKCTWEGVGLCEWFTQTDTCGEPSWEISATAAVDDTSSSSSSSTTAATSASVETSNTLTDGSLEVSMSGTDAPTTTVITTTTTSTTTNAPPEFTSGDETVQLTIDTSTLTSGKHTLYIQATDSDGYRGPVATTFIDVSRRRLRGGAMP